MFLKELKCFQINPSLESFYLQLTSTQHYIQWCSPLAGHSVCRGFPGGNKTASLDTKGSHKLVDESKDSVNAKL